MSKKNQSAMLGIALLSSGVMSLEISLSRVFSAVLMYQFVFLVISIAICGLGIGAMLCTFFKNPDKIPLGWAANLFGWSSILYLIIFLKFILPITPESLWLIASLVVLPYIFAGIFLTGLFSQMPEKSNTLYAFDLLGAGLASFFIILILNKFGAINACFFGAVIGVLAGATYRKTRITSFVSALLITLLLIYNIKNLWLDIPLPTSKGVGAYSNELFANMAKNEKIKILHTEWDSFARTDVVKNELIGENFLEIYTNGMVPTRLIKYFPETGRYDMLETIADIPFQLKKPEKVLCIGPGGGFDVLLAKMNGAKEIDGVEINPAIKKIMKMDQFIQFAGKPYEMDGVKLITADGRSYVKRTDKKYDMILLSLAKTDTGIFKMALIGGYIYTLEAFEEYLESLSSRGCFVFVNNGYAVNIRLFNTALQSLMRKRNLTLQQALSHVALLSVPYNQYGINPYQFSLIVNNQPFSEYERNRLLQLCMKRKYIPYLIPGKAIHPDFMSLVGPNASLASFITDFEKTWKKEYLRKKGSTNSDDIPRLNLFPATDDKPFFLDFFYRITRNMKSLFLGTLILIGIIGTGMFYRAKNLGRKEQKENSGKSFLLIFAYFFSLGVAFMMVEIYLIQKMILILGHPTYGVTVVLFFLLCGAGIGSYIAGLDKFKKVKKINQLVCLIVTITSILLGFYLNVSQYFVFSLTLGIRFLWSGTLSFCLGIFIGMPFPIGMKALSKFNSRYIPWMWCINGFSSLLGSIMAVAGSKIIGFHMVFMIGCGFYLITALCSSETWEKVSKPVKSY